MFVPQINSEDLNIIWQNKNMLNCMRFQCSYGPPVNFFALNKLLRLCFLRAWLSRNTTFLALFQKNLKMPLHGCWPWVVLLGRRNQSTQKKPPSLDRQTVPCNMLMLETEAGLK